jgi:anaerobic selenocysteine-containing dehydrogenase
MGTSVIPINADAAHGRATGIITGVGLTASVFAFGNNNTPTDIKNSKTFINWGGNPVVSQPHMMHFILEAQDKGMKYIVIDPAFNANAAKADWYIPINATTDGVLAFGALNEVFAQGWEDTDFIRDHTEAPLLIKEDGMFMKMSDLGVEPTEGPPDMYGQPTVIDPYVVWDEASNSAVALETATMPALEGITEVNGIRVQLVYDLLKEKVAEYPPSRASEICGVSEADIKELARVYAQEGPVNTYIMFGNNHYINGHYNYWSMYALSFCTGNSGKPGAACGFGYLSSAVLCSNSLNTAYVPTDKNGNMARMSSTRILMNEVGEVLRTGMFAGQPCPIKGVYIHNSNLMSTMAERAKTEAWIKAMDFVLVSDISMTETANYADIVLPAAHWFEQVDVYPSLATMPYIIWQDKATEPLFESKTEWQIYQLITRAQGLDSFFDMTEEEFIQLYLDNDMARSIGVTYEKLSTDKIASLLPSDPFITFEGGNYATATGRVRFYQDTVVSDYNVGQFIDESKEKTLYWEPTLEADLNSEARKKHPYHVISEHLRTRTHTQWWDVGYHRDYEPGPFVRINPEDAEELGIVEGDNARLFNDRGSVVMKAVISAGLPRKTLAAPRSFQEQEFIEGHFASLSTNAYNQVCANQAFNDVAVSIEKA